MRRFTDEELVAYADGESSAEQAEVISRAAREDAEVDARIRAFKESRRLLRAAFAPRATEPVPQRLLDALAEPQADGERESKVVPFASRRRPVEIRWRSYVPMAAAALVVLGVGINMKHVLPGAGAPAQIALAEPALVNAALESSPSGVPVAANGEEVTPLSTLRTADGTWCREFDARAGAGATLRKSRGLACREGARQWALRVIAAAPRSPDSPDNAYRTASGDAGPDLTNTIGKASALTPAEESEKIQEHWE